VQCCSDVRAEFSSLRHESPFSVTKSQDKMEYIRLNVF
jgi:hypothetical protein